MNRLRTKFTAIVWSLVLGISLAWAGLETVTHIQDLNANWPLGSDLASTSDDHVRNIKSALKTDFPNFNGTYTSASAPVFAIPSDTNTGMYSVGADDLGFSTGGTLRLDISTTAFTGTLPFRGQDGSNTAPAWSYSGDTNTGAYRVGADQLGFTAGGTLKAQVDTTGLALITGAANANGILYTERNDAQIAMRGGLTSNFGQVQLFGSGYTNFAGAVFVDAGNPGSGGTNDGTINLRTGASVTALRINTSQQLLGVDGTQTLPPFAFISDPDTGLYRIGANTLGLATGGNTQIQVTTTGTTIGAANTDFHTLNTGTAATASAGAATLPANPVAFITISINGTTRKIPYYAN